MHFTCTYSTFADGRLAEVFLQTHKPGSQSDINARDGAIATSLALQFGCPLEDLQRALSTTGPLGTALKLIAAIAPTRAGPNYKELSNET